MWSFFHGWRRKAGVITLVMACAIMGLWVRSRFFDEVIRFRVGAHAVNDFQLLESGFSWASIWEPSDAPRVWMEDGMPCVNTLIDDGMNVQWASEPGRGSEARAFQNIQWSWSLIGYRYGIQPADPRSGIGSRVLLMPYSVSSFCLTLLSAYLLLWKPRKLTCPTKLAAAQQVGENGNC